MISGPNGIVLSVAICSDAANGAKQMQIAIPRKDRGSSHPDGTKKGEHCAFSTLAKVAAGGADPFVLALAFACILMLGLAPARHFPPRQTQYLRPPLRGPPTTA